MKRQESEPQRQDRVAGNIHERIVARLAMELPALALDGVVPRAWFHADALSIALEASGYWLRHPEPLAAFLSPEQRTRLAGAGLALLAREFPIDWWRNAERYHCALTTDWKALALQTADRLQAERPAEERTALFAGADEASVIFASQREASAVAPDVQLTELRRDLRVACIPELGFSRSGNRRAWVMLVWAKDEQRLQGVLFAAWEKMSGIER